jgi:hypothetical protein
MKYGTGKGKVPKLHIIRRAGAAIGESVYPQKTKGIKI